MRLFGSSQATDPETFPVHYTDEEWRTRLSAAQYHVLRKHGTERAGTSALNAEKRHGRSPVLAVGKNCLSQKRNSKAGLAGRASMRRLWTPSASAKTAASS